MNKIDAIELTQALIRCPSVTPNHSGCFDLLEAALSHQGFSIRYLNTHEVSNFWATWGSGPQHLMFVGHVDVVPPTGDWHYPPFAAEIKDNILYGRGVVDMKGAIGAFISAFSAAKVSLNAQDVTISILLTSDEEGPAEHGIKHVAEIIRQEKCHIDLALIGEPTSEKHVGDTIKIGRRGSLNLTLISHGKAGHVAYPHLAINPNISLVNALALLTNLSLDRGYRGFDPSNLEITSIDCGNPTRNLIPNEARALINIRYNPSHTQDSLMAFIKETIVSQGSFTVIPNPGSEPFSCKPTPALELLQGIILKCTGSAAKLSTSGGTSDGRFLAQLCPVVELGLRNASAHHSDEYAPITDIYLLTDLYRKFLLHYCNLK